MIAEGLNGRLKQARCAAGYGRRRFARALDEACSAVTVARWEADGMPPTPTLYYLERICEVCGVTLDWLMYGDDTAQYTAALYPDTATDGGSIGERIKARRCTLSLNKAQLAEIIGAQPPKVYQWERGICKPTLYYIDKLCEALEISADELTKGRDE